jgi:hypothetical protein
VVILLALASAARAGEISPVGAVIEIESTRCEVQSPYRLVCKNIGRVCEAYRVREEAEHKRTFGCALETSPNYPCPPWEQRLSAIKQNSELFGHCTPFSFGGW